MKRNTWNYLVDGITLLAMLAVLCTGLLLRYVLPPGSGRSGRVLWGLDRHEWGDVHFWITLSLLGLLLIHLVLHWSWVCTTTRLIVLRNRARAKMSGDARNLWGAGALCLLAALLSAFLFIAQESVRQVGVDGRQRGRIANQHLVDQSPAHLDGSAEVRQDQDRAQRRRRGGT